MANLVFTGHETRGKELHKLLENLGGVDAGYIDCNCITCYYYINREGYMECSNSIPSYMNNRVIMSLEEFERRYPYKVGDKVRIPYYESEIRISSMRWDGYNVQYEVVTDEVEWYSTAELNDFNNTKNSKEEIVDTGCCSMPTIPPSYKLSVKQLEKMKQTIVFSNDSPDEIELVLGDNYEVKVKEGKTYVVKKKQKYPKTYKECFNICFGDKYHIIQVVGLDGLGNNKELFENFIKLKICRDAYWKIAGDWKPDWEDGNTTKYTISCVKNKIELRKAHEYTFTLAFPTEEMRDAFYENFKKLIEECKELL